jgi:uncharacterized protein
MSEFGPSSSQAPVLTGESSRAGFILRVYNHLFGAVVLFTLLEVAYFKAGIAEPMARAMLGTNWLLVLGAFMVVSWLATRFAFSSASLGAQYAALGAYVVAESVIFVPLLFVANFYAPGAIQSAALITLVGFTGLSAIAYISKSDFRFLGALLKWAGVVALLAIVGGVIFGFQLGTWFSVAMIGLAGGAILYDTKTIIQVFPEDRYVGASLKLFASVALMFWYALRLVMGSRR